jgi:hypothetical protein
LSEKEEVLEKSNYEIRGWVIEKSNEIESKINLLITDYYLPKERSDFLEIIMNSSIVNMGGKYKILENISSFDNKIINHWRTINSIRNYFAHANNQIPVNVTVTYQEISKTFNIPSQIRYMHSSGKMKQDSIENLISNFYDSHQIVMDYLNNNYGRTT